MDSSGRREQGGRPQAVTGKKADEGNAEGLKDLIVDVAAFARLEGLEGHARAAELRMTYC